MSGEKKIDKEEMPRKSERLTWDKMNAEQKKDNVIVSIKTVCILIWLGILIYYYVKGGMAAVGLISIWYFLSCIGYWAFTSGKDMKLIRNQPDVIMSYLINIIWLILLIHWFVISWLFAIMWIGATAFISWIRKPITIHFTITKK